jgi:hypothetical protein
MNTKVRLLRGPIQRFAKINPILSSQSKMIELRKRMHEHIMNSHLLPTISERIPAEKLPIE